jgi:hypothetical protein
MYWDKADIDFPKSGFLPVPSKLLQDAGLYIFDQYSFTMQRIDCFRQKHNDPNSLPPGLAIVGTPGIGELFPIHLFI